MFAGPGASPACSVSAELLTPVTASSKGAGSECIILTLSLPCSNVLNHRELDRDGEGVFQWRLLQRPGDHSLSQILTGFLH